MPSAMNTRSDPAPARIAKKQLNDVPLCFTPSAVHNGRGKPRALRSPAVTSLSPNPRVFQASTLARVRSGVGVGDSVIGGLPDALQAIAGPDKQSRRRQTHERKQQGVFDQVLSL